MAESQGEGTATGEEQRRPVPGARRARPAARHDHHDDPAFITRTKFLTGVALVTGGVMTAAILVPVVGFAVADPLKEEEWRWVDIGPLPDFPDGKTTSIAVSGPAPESDRRAYIRHKDGRDHRDLEPLRPPGLPGRVLGRAATSTPAPATAAPTTRWAWSPPARRRARSTASTSSSSAPDGKDIALQEVPAHGCPTPRARPDGAPAGRPAVLDRRRTRTRTSCTVPGEPVTGVALQPLPLSE